VAKIGCVCVSTRDPNHAPQEAHLRAAGCEIVLTATWWCSISRRPRTPKPLMPGSAASCYRSNRHAGGAEGRSCDGLDRYE
jgi:hypothetical protein